MENFAGKDYGDNSQIEAKIINSDTIIVPSDPVKKSEQIKDGFLTVANLFLEHFSQTFTAFKLKPPKHITDISSKINHQISKNINTETDNSPAYALPQIPDPSLQAQKQIRIQSLSNQDHAEIKKPPANPVVAGNIRTHKPTNLKPPNIPYPDIHDFSDRVPKIVTGQIISMNIHPRLSFLPKSISGIFYLLAFAYIILTLIFTGTIIDMAVNITKSGQSEPILLLKNYPNISLLPMVTATFAMIFFFNAIFIRGLSKPAYALGFLSLASIPILSALYLPSLTQPLVRLVSVYGSNSNLQFVLSPANYRLISNLYPNFLIFESGLILMLFSFKEFNHSRKI